MIKTEKIKLMTTGLLIGAVNGLFGAGGGMLAVPLLKSCKMSQKKAHANSVAVILPLCAVSVVFYYIKGHVDLKTAGLLIPFGLAGALVGTLIMKKISGLALKRIFAFVLIYAGVRMFL